jgi:hypothetical protein
MIIMYIKIKDPKGPKFKINKRCYYIKMNNFIFSSLVYYLSLQRCSTYNDFSIHGLWPFLVVIHNFAQTNNLIYLRLNLFWMT